MEAIDITIPDDAKAERLDKALAKLLPQSAALSRSRLQELIHAGHVSSNGEAQRNVKALAMPGQHYQIICPDPIALELEAENIPLDVYFEDQDLLVVNKPSGMVVHPGTGVRTGTLVQALLYHCGDTLSGIGGVERPGIVHRIDKDTSGLLVVAKSDQAHIGLSDQFRAHSIHRRYRAFCYGAPKYGDPKLAAMDGVDIAHHRIKIDLPIDRHKTDRLKMAVRETGKRAVTYCDIERNHHSGSLAEIRCQLETGRTHQIRVHMTHIGFPLLGDPLYGRGSHNLSKAVPDELREAIHALTGQALHAEELGFVHPVSGNKLRFQAPLPKHMQIISDLFDG